MQVNFDCNCPKPQFGMAFRRVPREHMPSFFDYTKISSGDPVYDRGVRRFIKAQRRNELTYTRYNQDDAIEVFDTAVGGSLLRSFENTKKSHIETVTEGKNPVVKFIRRAFSRLFAPEDFIPENMYQAAELTKSIEKNV